MIARYIKWVRHEDKAPWLALGWLNTGPLPGPHGRWAVGMIWLCDCEVREP